MNFIQKAVGTMKKHTIAFAVLSLAATLCGCEKNAPPNDSNAISQSVNEVISTDATTTYDNMTNTEKKRICEYIQERYDYYDRLEGRDTGDKYSEQIWEDVMELYSLEEWQVTSIWNNYYSY